MALKRSMRVRVSFDPDVLALARRAARASDCTVSALIYNIVERELREAKAEQDRQTVVLEYQSIQLDLVLAHLNPDLKKKARDILKARRAENSLPLEASNAL